METRVDMVDGELDRAFLFDLLDGEVGFAQELLEAYEQAALGWVEQAKEACLAGDAPVAIRAFHTLKGTAASVGLVLLQELALTCELQAKAHDLDFCLAQVPQVEALVKSGERCLAEVVDDLRNELA